MLQKERERNSLKSSWNSWKGILIIGSIIILLTAFLLLFYLQPNKKVVTQNIVKKNKKLFTNEFNREFIGDNERILIVKNEDIINHKVIFDLNDSKISKVEVVALNKDIAKDFDIRLYVYNKNNEYVITTNNSINSNLTYKLFETKNERIEIGYKDDPSINSLKIEDLVVIKISYGMAE